MSRYKTRAPRTNSSDENSRGDGKEWERKDDQCDDNAETVPHKDLGTVVALGEIAAYPSKSLGRNTHIAEPLLGNFSSHPHRRGPHGEPSHCQLQ